MKQPPAETTLKLEVRSVTQLLDRDGSPLVEPRIHPDVAEVLWADASEEPKSERFRIEITAPTVDACDEERVREAIRYHYTWEARKAHEEIDETLRDGRKSLVIGLLVVVLLLTLAEVLLIWSSGRFMAAVSESLIIFSWVVMWSPGELLLYAHLPIRRRRKLSEKLAEAEVIVRAR